MAKPILLLPLQQVQKLIDQMNQAYNSDIRCPAHPFVVSFFDDGTPQPTRLGTSRSRDDVDNMAASIASVPDNYGEFRQDLSLEPLPAVTASISETTKRPTEQSYADFKAKMERILAATKKSKQVARKKKNDERFLRLQDFVKQLKRGQRYFGLRPKVTRMPLPDPAATWFEQQQRHEQDLRRCGILLDPLDVSRPAPYALENEVVLVCVDVEAYERDNRKITEIGVSTLDTLDLVGMAPGERGENWIPHIRSRHIRIRGREHLKNKDFCPGDADSFQFGDSEWVSLNEAAEVVDQCFEYPFSAQCKKKSETSVLAATAPLSPLRRVPTIDVDPVAKMNVVDTGNAAQDAANKATASHILHGDPAHSSGSAGECFQPQEGPRKRNVVFVGHDVRNEFEYLRELGSQIFSPSRGTYPITTVEIMSNSAGLRANSQFFRGTTDAAAGRGETLNSIIEALDTAVLYRVLVRETHNYSLGKIMLGLGKTAWHLHNAGNDARYTLEALIGICIRARSEEDEASVTASGSILTENVKNGRWSEEVEKKVQEETNKVEQDIRDKCEGWKKATTPPAELVKQMHSLQIVGEEGKKGEMEVEAVNAKENLDPKESEQDDYLNTIVYRDPAATGGQYQIRTENLDVGEPEVGGLAKMVEGGNNGKKKASRRDRANVE